MNRFFFRTIRALDPALLAALFLTACGVTEQAGRDIADGQKLSAEQLAAQKAAQRGEVLKIDRPYYGSAVEVKRGAQRGDPLPKRVEGAKGLDLSLKGQSDVNTIAAALTGATGIQVNVRTRYILPSGDVVEVPIGTRMAASYTGSLSAFLDRLSSRMDVAWHHDKGVITIDRMVTRTWRVALPLGKTEITDTATPERAPTIASTRTLDPWTDLEARLKPLAPPPARVTITPNAGRVEVFGPPSVQKTVATVLDDVAKIAAMRIGLETAVYFVDTDKADEFGVALENVGGAIGRFRGRDVAATLTAAARADGGGLTISRGNGAIDFKALARDNAVVDYRLASTVTQSGTISPIELTEERRYIGSITSETDEETGVTTRTPQVEDLTTGLVITALPRLVDDQRIQLDLTVGQRELVDFNVELVDGTDLRLPTVNNRQIRNRTVLAAGETLVLSGYEQDFSSRSKSGLGPFKAIGLGGRNKAQVRKVRMIIFVRPSIIAQGRGRS